MKDAQRIVDLFKSYMALREETGFMGYEDSGRVQVYERTFNFDALPGEAKETYRGESPYPWEYEKEFGGLQFFYVTAHRRE